MIERTCHHDMPLGLETRDLGSFGEAAGTKLGQLDGIVIEEDSQLAERLEILIDTWRADQSEWFLAPLESHRREQPGQSIEVIAVKMRDEDAAQPVKRESGAHDLQLRTFAAIKEPPFTFGGYGECAHIASGSRTPGTGPEWNDSQEKRVTLPDFS